MKWIAALVQAVEMVHDDGNASNDTAKSPLNNLAIRFDIIFSKWPKTMSQATAFIDRICHPNAISAIHLFNWPVENCHSLHRNTPKFWMVFVDSAYRAYIDSSDCVHPLVYTVHSGNLFTSPFGQRNDLSGWESGMGTAPNDLFIWSGSCTGHELKNDGYPDKFPFVQFHYLRQMRIHRRTRKFTPRWMPNSQSSPWINIFWCSFFHISFAVDVRAK